MQLAFAGLGGLMSFAAFILIVCASFSHATWNLLSKRAASAGSTFVFAYTLFCCLIYSPWVIWLFAHRVLVWSWPALVCIVLSGIVHLGYSLCLQRGYQVADLSVVYPVARGTAPMLSSVAAFALLRETPSLGGLTGLAAVVAGIGLISTDGDLAAFRRPRGQVGVLWGAATGCLIAIYTIIDAYAVKNVGVQPVIQNWGADMVRLAVLAPITLNRPVLLTERMRGRWPLAVAVGLLWPLSYILVLTALKMGAPISVVAPTREMSMMIGALLGMAVLREPVGRWRIIGCVVMFAGIVLLGRS